jgi:hypothetical protein
VADLKPWHNAPACPKCATTVATPAAIDIPSEWAPDFSIAVEQLRCPACGASWYETDITKVVQAWWSAGAYAGKTATEAKRD